MINIDSKNEAYERLDEFESTVPDAEAFLVELFVRFLGTDEVYYYYENSQYIFYPDPHFSNLREKFSLELSDDKSSITVQYWKHDSNTEPTAVTKFKFDNAKNTYVELK